jgi:ribosome-associated translation inhibitor RaiA
MKHLILLLLSTLGVFDAFLVPPQRQLTRPAARHPQRPDVSVGLFGDFFKKLRGDKDGGEADGSKASDTDAPLPEKAETTPEAKADGASFFVQSSTPPPTPQEQETPQSVAQKLRAQAARIRLEAEKSQVQLTIDKISKLDSQLQKVKMKQDAGEAVDEKERRSLEENLALLQSQLVKDEKGEISFVPPKVVPLPKANATSSRESTIVKIDSSVPAEERLVTQESIPPPLSEEDLQAIVQKYNEAPEFLRTMIAKIAGFADDPSNSTAIINQLYQDEQQIELQTAFLRTNITESRSMLERAYAKSKDLEPSQAEIEDKVEQLGNLPTFVKKLITGSTNDTEIALDLLREQGKRNKKKIEGGLFGFTKDKTKDNVIGRDGERLDKNSGTFDRMFTQDEDTETIPSLNNDLSLLMESTFPKSTRKEGETPSQKEVNTFINQVLGVTGAFVPEGEALLVPGGWVCFLCLLLLLLHVSLSSQKRQLNTKSICIHR